MECYYHPERESTDKCAICGKSICKECGLEIAGKTYCKECLEKIVGLGLDNKTPAKEETVAEKPVKSEPVRLEKQPAESIYDPQADIQYEEPLYAEKVPENTYVAENKAIRDDSPYNIKDNINYSGGLESSYLDDIEPKQEPNYTQDLRKQPQVTQNEFDYPPEVKTQRRAEPQEYIYPDHSYEPQPTSARMELEDKYEKYLDDLYFDENEVPLTEQLAKDEEQFGSLTRKPYQPKPEPPALKDIPQQREIPKNETPEQMEARIRAELAREMKGEKPIHNLNYQQEKEPLGIIDIILTIILIIVILIVIYYLIYLFVLNASYPTFMDAVYALSNPQNVINNILSN